MASGVLSRAVPGRLTLRGAAAAALLAAPTALAFFSGGYFWEARLWAAVAVWAGLALVALALPARFPRSRSALVCLAGLTGLTAWTAVSIAWAPVRDPALADAERLALYLGFALGGVILLRGAAARAVEPALAAGALVVSGYALATRLLPGLVPSHHGVRAADRLDQPLTYWNALGALAAMGLVLALRVASDPDRDPRLRVAGAAATPALSLALYLTLSRAALAAAAVGIALLVALARDRATVRTALLVVGAGTLTVALVTRIPAVGRVGGGEGQGAAALALLLAISAALGVAHARLWPAAPRARMKVSGRGPIAALAAAAALVLVALVAPSLGGESKPATHNGDLPRGAARLRTLQTNRVKYWKVAAEGFADHPLRGTGTRGFATIWLEKRKISETATDAHSLEVETLAELGLVGALLLAAFLGGAGVALARLLSAGPSTRSLALGWAAAGSVFLVHSAVDWDWEMPAVALIFLALVAATLAASDQVEDAPKG